MTSSLSSAWFLPALLSAVPQSVKLNGPLVRNAEQGGSDVGGVLVSPDGQWLVYMADQEVDGLTGLYSTPFDGSASARKVSASGWVYPGFQISAAGERVVFVDESPAVVSEIRSAPLDGSVAPVRLNANLPSGGDVTAHFALSPDGTRVVFHADQAVDNVFELWSVPSDGSAAPVRLNAPLAGGRDVRQPVSAVSDTSFRITPDGARVLYIADQVQDGLDELFSVAITGGATLKLSAPLALGGNVTDFLVSPDGLWVVYRADQDQEDRFELYTVPVAGGVPPVKLNGVLPAQGDVPIRSVAIDPTSAFVVYRADQQLDERFELFRAPLDGSAASVKLNSTLVAAGDVTSFGIAPGGERVVYLADALIDERYALHSVPLDASLPAVKLNAALPAAGDVGDFWFSADGAAVVYWADQLQDGVDELFRVPVAGGVPPVKLSGALVPEGDVERPALVSASGLVLYRADALVDGKTELWVVPLDASAPPARLDANAQGFSDVSAFVVDAAGTRVGFLADAWIDDQFELLGVPIRGGSAPIRLNGALIEPPVVGDVAVFAWSPDGRRVLFTADGSVDERWELYSANPGTLAPAERLSDPELSTTTSTTPCWFASDSTRVVYRNQFVPPVPGVHPDDDVFSAPRDGGVPPLSIGDESDDGAFDFAFALPGNAFVYGQVQAGAGPSPTVHVWNAAIDGSRAPFELISPGPGWVARLVASPHQDLVLCATVTGSSYTLWLAPVDGSAPALTLAGPLVSLGQVHFAPAQERVYFVGAFGVGDPDELWSVPIGGGTPVRLHPALVPGRGVDPAFLVAPDGARVFYRADQDVDATYELHAVPALGGASVRLSGPMVAGGSVEASSASGELQFTLDPTGTRVVYRADQVTDGVPELFSAPVDGSAPALRVNAPLVAGRAVPRSGFRLVPDGLRVVYVANQDQAASDELYVAWLDGSQAPLRLNPPMVSGGGLRSFQGPHLEVLGSRVLYLADQELDEAYALFAVPLDGSQHAERLCGPLVSGGDVWTFQVGPSGRVAYIADEERDGVFELFLVLETPENPGQGRTRPGSGTGSRTIP